MTKPAVAVAATGNPIAADVATQLRMGTLHAAMNGTVMNAPPAPTMLAMTLMTAPTPMRPPRPGSRCVGFGCRSIQMLVAAAATNTPKKAESTAVDILPTINGPSSEPTMSPGASPKTTGHRIARCRWCTRTEAVDVKRIVAVAVAIAMCTTCSGGNPSRVKMNVRSGTIVMPPPMPRSPARNPTIAPSARKAAISAGSIFSARR
jgi:hypothetical protein